MKKLIRPLILLLALTLCCSFVSAASDTDDMGICPIAENLELTTYRGVSVGGKFSATDPDGQDVTFEICTPPNKGVIELGEDGEFVYTPNEGRKGKDYFGYRAIDSDGNCSQEATVIIRILKQKTKVTYSDMHGTGAEYSAVMLAENGIFTGENLAGVYVFSPEKALTRAEFLAMCMKLADVELLSGIASTGFADDSSISAWARPYVGTALKNGIISGYSNERGAAVFNESALITSAEAAVMLDRTLGITDTVSVWSQLDDTVPAWAAQSMANLSACGMLPRGMSVMSDTLTRAQAAQMLSEAMVLLENR